MLPTISLLLALGLVIYFLREHAAHSTKVLGIKYRVHVNGIRGKSSVTRLIAGVLRESKLRTIGKATGSDTNIITHQGQDLKVNRKGPANVFENYRIIRDYVQKDTDVIVFECMAVKPRYQKFLEEKVIKSNIGIITNVREDHVEEMGHTLEKIAKSLSSTVPVNGYLICADDNKSVQDVLKKVCSKKGTQFINALNYHVDDEYLLKFPYVEHKENIQVGLAIADLLHIPTGVALRGMKNVAPDPGVLSIQKFKVENKTVVWANIFAANDRQSVIKCVNMVSEKCKSLSPETVCLLNNREDRPERAAHFSKFVVDDFKFDHIAIIGDLQTQVANRINSYGYKNVIKLAKYIKMDGKSLVSEILKNTSAPNVLILGMENIHTPQAERIMDYFAKLEEKN